DRSAESFVARARLSVGVDRLCIVFRANAEVVQRDELFRGGAGAEAREWERGARERITSEEAGVGVTENVSRHRKRRGSIKLPRAIAPLGLECVSQCILDAVAPRLT